MAQPRVYAICIYISCKKSKDNTCTYMLMGIGEGCQHIPPPIAGTAMGQAVNKQQYARAAIAVPHAVL